VSVIKHMRLRIEHEQAEFEGGGGRIQAVRSVHMKLLRELFKVLGHAKFKQEVLHLTERLKEPGLKLGVRKTYDQTFVGLRGLLLQAKKMAEEISSMLLTAFTQLNTEYGLSLTVPPLPDLEKYLQSLTDIEQSHVHYLGFGHTFKLTQPEFLRALGDVRWPAGCVWCTNRLPMTLRSGTRLPQGSWDAQLRDRRRKLLPSSRGGGSHTRGSRGT
jgi:hypothetical protein